MSKRESLINSISGTRPGFSKLVEISKPAVDHEITTLRNLHEGIIANARNMVQNAILIGEILTQKKSKLKHGEFIPWVESNLNFKIRTAQRYVKMFENRELINASALTHLEDAYKLIAGPIADEKEINPSSTKKPDDLYKEWKAGKNINKSDKQVLATWIKEKTTDLKFKISQLESDLKKLK
ncbi:MAG: DUF3102 domain-containing protein [Leptospira sp.]|nr:DUF3102 domain-containing protein [Leptospira sp.]